MVFGFNKKEKTNKASSSSAAADATTSNVGRTNGARIENINSSGQRVVHCDKQPHPHEPISISRSDGLKHDLNAITSTADISDLVEQMKGDGSGGKLNQEKDEKEHSHINVRRSDGIHHDIINVFQKNKSDSRGISMRMTSPNRRSNSVSVAGSNTLPGSSTSIKLSRASSASAAVSNGGFWSLSSKINKPPQLTVTSTDRKGSHSQPTTPTNRMKREIVVADGIASSVAFHSHYFPSHVRIVHISDTHNLLQRGKRNIYLPAGNILVHSGNFTNFGSKTEYERFNDWLGSIKGYYHYRIICIGARDVKEFGNNWDVMRNLLTNATHVLCHNEAIVLGIRFYAAPWHWAHKADYNIRAGAPVSATARFDEIPDGTQVLITHGPAFGTLDSASCAGSKDLAQVIRRVRPAVHLHGHVKGSHGVSFPFANAPLVVNSALSDPDRKVLYATAHVVKATKIEAPLTADQKLLNYGSWTFEIDSVMESS